MTRVGVLAFGGTISQVTGASGASAPGFDVRRLADAAAGLPTDFEFAAVAAQPSKDVTPSDWERAAHVLRDGARDGWEAVIVLHGTDTLHWTAAALSFLLADLPMPVVLTGSMIPGGDAGSDSASNFRAATATAIDAAMRGVAIAFSADASCERAVILRGVNSRKVHSSAVDAFAAIGSSPLGVVEDDRVTWNRLPRASTLHGLPPLGGTLSARVPLIAHSPGLSASMLSAILAHSDGIVLAGTGVGHVSSDHLTVLRDFTGPIVFSTQVAGGGEQLGMYAGDRHALALPNAIRARSMTAETAQVKLIWALSGPRDRVRDVMETDVCGELRSFDL